MIFDTLKEFAQHSAKNNQLKLLEFSLCELLTYVEISDGKKSYLGVTLTPKNEGEINNPQFSSLENILTNNNYDIAARAVGLAAINAIGLYELSKQKDLNLKKNIQEELAKMILENTTDRENIVFIGHLTPVVAKLKQEGRKDVSVFCRAKTNFQEHIYNDIFEYEETSKASVVIITGASLIGSTIDALLKFTQNAKMVILAGFSAGAYPVWLEDLGITHIASTYLQDFSKDIIQDCSLEDVFKNPCYIQKISQKSCK